MKDLFSKFTDFDSLEFTLWSNDISINKILFQYFNFIDTKRHILSNFKSLLHWDNLVFFDFLIKEFLDLDVNFHFWVDISTNRYKLYVSLYNLSFEDSIKKIVSIKNN